MTLSDDERKERARWARIKRVYGITKEQYIELDIGHCYVCLRPWDGAVIPCIDHDHVTGEVRGLLCRYCNRYVVGRHRVPDFLRRAADYLALPRRGWLVPKQKKKRRKKRKATK